MKFAQYTGRVHATEAPAEGMSSRTFTCPRCSGICPVLFIPAYEDEIVSVELAFPSAVTIQAEATFTNGNDYVEVFMGSCRVCGAIYQAWRTQINVGVRARLEEITRRGVPPTDAERRVGVHEWMQIE